MKIGSLFSGYRGLDMGVQLALGGDVVWDCEIDPSASKILARHWPDVPNLGDITTVDWTAVEPVDVITGGSPCQDVSHAGKRAGMRTGTRSGLWASMCGAIETIRPSLVVWENVRGVLSAGADSGVEPCSLCMGDTGGPALRALGRVLGDLAELGYDAQWQGVRASDVGAPHGRFRVFVVATDARLVPGQPRRVAGPGEAGSGRARGQLAGRDRAPAADAEGVQREREQPARTRRRQPEGQTRDSDGDAAAHTDDPRLEGREPATGRLLSDGCAAPYATSDGRHEGRTEPARIIGRRDAAERGDDAAPDADGDGRARVEERDGVPGTGRGTTQLRDDADRLRMAAREIHGPEAAADASSGSHSHQSFRGDAQGQYERALARPGDRDRAGDPAPRVHDGGRTAAIVEWGQYEPAVRRWERLTRPAPAPTEPGSKGQPRLSPRFVEWLMGLPAGHVTDVPGLSRNDQLKALGNGVVPQQAAAAIRALIDVEAAA